MHLYPVNGASYRVGKNDTPFSYRDCVVDYYDKTYDLSKIRTVDFVMIPFAELRGRLEP